MGECLMKKPFDFFENEGTLLRIFPKLRFSMYPSGDVFETRALISIENMLFPEVEETEFTVQADTVNYEVLLTGLVEDQIDVTEIDIELEDLGAKNQTDQYEDGTPLYEVGIKDGQKHGNYFEYFPTGELKMKGKYKHDLKSGTWKHYDVDGNLVKREKYRDGELVN